MSLEVVSETAQVCGGFEAMRPSNDDIPDRLGPAESRTNGRFEICEVCEVCEQNNKMMEGWERWER